MPRTDNALLVAASGFVVASLGSCIDIGGRGDPVVTTETGDSIAADSVVPIDTVADDTDTGAEVGPDSAADSTLLDTTPDAPDGADTDADAVVPFDPATIPGMSLWLRADKNVTATAGSVSAWTDGSGAGHIFTQPTPTNQPTVVLSSIGTQPAIRFNGTSTSLKGPALSNLKTATEVTLFMVYKPIAAKRDSATVYQNDGIFSDGQAYFGLALRATGGVSAYNYTTGLNATTGVPLTMAVSVLLTLRHDGTTMTLRKNGEPPVTVATAETASLVQPMILGAGYNEALFGEFDLGEVLAYKRGLLTGEEASVRAYLAGRYGLF